LCYAAKKSATILKPALSNAYVIISMTLRSKKKRYSKEPAVLKIRHRLGVNGRYLFELPLQIEVEKVGFEHRGGWMKLGIEQRSVAGGYVSSGEPG
jgi:hypothetical protein